MAQDAEKNRPEQDKDDSEHTKDRIPEPDPRLRDDAKKSADEEKKKKKKNSFPNSDCPSIQSTSRAPSLRPWTEVVDMIYPLPTLLRGSELFIPPQERRNEIRFSRHAPMNAKC